MTKQLPDNEVPLALESLEGPWGKLLDLTQSATVALEEKVVLLFSLAT